MAVLNRSIDSLNNSILAVFHLGPLGSRETGSKSGQIGVLYRNFEFLLFFPIFYSRVVSFNKFKVDLLKISVVLRNWSLMIAITLCL